MTGIMCDMKQNAMAGSAVPVSLVQFLIVGHLSSAAWLMVLLLTGAVSS